ncbi:autoinducer 2 sensor kinase/phosphatase LuxQ [Acrasis kona]|uniref:histidine kinase n=1 Tax=Acrasis kona TaxID=1008807 RepID=A0AAW2Z1H3_9EUKA
MLMARATNKIEKNSIYVQQILQSNTFSKLNESLSVGREALKELGINLPNNDSPDVAHLFNKELDLIVKRLEELGKTPDGYIDCSEMLKPADQETQCFSTLTTSLIVTAYLYDEKIFPLLASITARVILETCLMPASSTSLAYFAIVLVSKSEFNLARDVSNLAMHCATKLFPDHLAERCRTTHLYNIFCHHWFRPICEIIPSSKEAFTMGLDCGETTYAVYTFSASCCMHLYCGNNINLVINDIKTGLAAARKYKNHIIDELVSQVECVYKMLVSIHLTPEQLKAMDDQLFEPLVNKLPQVRHLTHRLMLRFLFDGVSTLDDVNNEYQCMLKIDEILPFMVSMYDNVILLFYESLMLVRCIKCLRGLDSFDPLLKQELNARLDRNVSSLTLWNNIYSDNILNKLLLIKAQISAYVLDEGYVSLKYYKESIKESEKQQFTQETAVALELEGEYWLNVLQDQDHGKLCIQRSYNAYKKWGITRKVKDLLSKYDHLVESVVQLSPSTSNASSLTNTMNLNSAYFDLKSILRGSHVISSSIDIHKLLSNIMKIVIETAGATDGSIILEGRVEAQYSNNNIDTECSIPLDQWKDGCKSIVDHVTRDQTSIVLGCAHTDPLYEYIKNDPYVMSRHTKSVLCMPVIYQNEVKAVLYLENTLTTDCFKSEQVNVLNILITQVAISLENSKFFDSRMKAMEELAEVQTNRAREEEAFRRKQEEFIDRICHEIRNPIQGITGNCEVINHLLMKLSRTTTNINLVEEIHSYVGSISSCAQYQKVITDDVLTLSKLEFNQVTLVAQQTEISNVFTNVVRMFQGQANKNGIALLECDESRFSQVLTNLVSNAIKFTPTGIIEICCMHRPYGDANSNLVEIETSVTDTGIGISADDLETIFDRFAQVTQRATSDYNGSGLGLFICKMMVELMGGRITVHSTVNSGSTFVFSTIAKKIKILDSATKHTKIDTSRNTNIINLDVLNTSSKENAHVLIVEDNKINQKVLAKMVGHYHCSFVVANNGLEGLNKFKTEKFDLVFMDVSMPVMDGYESTRQIREYEIQQACAPTVIVGLSGNARQGKVMMVCLTYFSAEHLEAGLASGMTMYITKPIQQRDIIKIIDSIKQV